MHAISFAMNMIQYLSLQYSSVTVKPEQTTSIPELTPAIVHVYAHVLLLLHVLLYIFVSIFTFNCKAWWFTSRPTFIGP